MKPLKAAKYTIRRLAPKMKKVLSMFGNPFVFSGPQGHFF